MVTASQPRTGDRHVRELGDEETCDSDVLPAEAQDAREVAQQIKAEARAVTQVSMALHDGAFISRCAWCGRYRIGDDWMTVSRSRVIHQSRTTHGICEDCMAALRGAGHSA